VQEEALFEFSGSSLENECPVGFGFEEKASVVI